MKRWRTVIGLLVGLIGMMSLAAAETVQLAWDASERADGYQVHYGQASGHYQQVIDVGASLNASVGGLQAGETYYFAATAYNEGGESDYSNEVSVTLDPVDPPDDGDMMAPTAEITSPTHGGTVPRKAQVTIQVSAADNVGVTAVVITVNGTVLCEDTAAPYQCLWNVPAAGGPKRTYDLQASATDAAGNIGYSSVVTVWAK